MNRRNSIQVIVFVIVMIIFSLGILASDKDIIVKAFYFMSIGLLSYMLVYVFSNITSDKTNKKIVSKKIAITTLLWAMTFIIANFLEYKTIFKVLNLLAFFVIGTAVYELFNKKYNRENKEIDVFRFGYVWIGFVLLVPIMVVLVIIGY